MQVACSLARFSIHPYHFGIRVCDFSLMMTVLACVTRERQSAFSEVGLHRLSWSPGTLPLRNEVEVASECICKPEASGTRICLRIVTMLTRPAPNTHSRYNAATGVWA